MAEQKQQKKDVQEGEVVGEGTSVASKSTPPWPAITISVFVAVVLGAILIAGWAWVSTALHKVSTSREFGETSRLFERGLEPREDAGPGQRGVWGMMTPAASGVITKVDGNALTVAGQGKQVTVVLDDDTTVTGDKTEVAVNDTVVVIGEENDDGTVQATRIVVRNEASERRESQPRRTVPNV